jgi:hypothetical protein
MNNDTAEIKHGEMNKVRETRLKSFKPVLIMHG